MNKKNKEILVVEVDRLTKTQIKNGLREKGYRVTTVSSAREAIDFCIFTLYTTAFQNSISNFNSYSF